MGIYLVRMAIKKRTQKTKLQAINEELELLGIEPIADTDPCPERTRFLRHIQSPDFDDKDWVKTYKSLKEQYALAFHDYFAHVYPYVLFEKGEDKVYWEYNEQEGVYEELTVSSAMSLVIELLIIERLTERATAHFAKDVLARYRAVYADRGVSYDAFDIDDSWFHAQNGWVCLSTLVFEPHTPDRLSRRKSAVSYDAEATCPLYDKFLDTDIRLKMDQVRVIDQFSGLCLTNDITQQKMLTIIGRPGCGKSTLLAAWSHVLGEMAIEKKLTELQGDAMRFSGSSFVGSTLCWFDEVDVKKAEMGNSLGTMITGQHINVERKGVNGIIKARNSVKCVLTANRLPHNAEVGIYRRLILVNFPFSFSDTDTAILDISEKLKSESSGILNRMIKGLRDLRKMGTFTTITGHTDLIEEYKAQSDTVAEFLDTFFEPGSADDYIETQSLLSAYKNFTYDKSFMILTPQKFGRLLASQPLTRFSQIEPKLIFGSGRCWTGLVLKSEYKFNDHTGIIEHVSETNF